MDDTDNVIDLSKEFENRQQRNRPQTALEVFTRLGDPSVMERILDAPLGVDRRPEILIR